MDDSNSIGTIVYIIIMILVFVGSALKKKKKRPSGKKPSPAFKIPSLKTQDTPAGKFSNFISGLFEEESKKTEQPFYQYESDYTEDSPIINGKFEEQAKGQYSSEGISVFTEDDPNTSTIETGIEKELSTTKYKMANEEDKHYQIQEKEKEKELKQILSDFELKKAIVFSEILKPKYFKVTDF